MTEVFQEITFYEVNYRCPKCNEANMEQIIQGTFQHGCPQCGFIAKLGAPYPREKKRVSLRPKTESEMTLVEDVLHTEEIKEEDVGKSYWKGKAEELERLNTELISRVTSLIQDRGDDIKREERLAHFKELAEGREEIIEDQRKVIELQRKKLDELETEALPVSHADLVKFTRLLIHFIGAPRLKKVVEEAATDATS